MSSRRVALPGIGRIVQIAHDWIGPLVAEERPVRRTNHVLPQNRARRDVPEENEEVITTARPSDPSRQDNVDQDTPQSTTQPRSSPNEGAPPSGGMVRQWMSELAGAARPTAADGTTVRVPSDSEIRMLTGMFPDIGRDAILGVLQRRCVITLLTSTVTPSLSIVDS